VTTATGLALTQQHRVRQGQLAVTTLEAMLGLYPLLIRLGLLDANTPRWLDLATALVVRNRAQSAALASRYLLAYRVAELGPQAAVDGYAPLPAMDANLEAIRTSLMVLGPVAYKRHAAQQLGVEPRELTPQALAELRLPPTLQQKQAATVARAAVRHVRNGARETTDGVLRSDKRVVGYVRVVGNAPCWFCAMLVSRGPVYSGDSFQDSDPRFHGEGDQKVHDGCGCDLLPLYSRDNPPFLDKTREYEQLWMQTNGVLAFRQAFEGRATPTR